MLKNDIMQILEKNKEDIKISFCIDDKEIDKIKEFLNQSHKGFRAVIDDLSLSDLTDRGKMVLCCLIGYVNCTQTKKIFE